MKKRIDRRTFRKKDKKQILALCALLAVSLAILLIIAVLAAKGKEDSWAFFEKRPNWKVEEVNVLPMLLDPNPYSRPQKALVKVKGVVVHYTANPGTDAKDNRNYFNNLGITGKTYGSSHYIIGLDGSIVQCVPLNEVAYASNQRNDDTISIECCHPKKNGKFTKETYQSLVELTAWLCGEYGLDKNEIIRHYDVTGKNCPKYFVENEEKWEEFKEDVMRYLEENNILE